MSADTDLTQTIADAAAAGVQSVTVDGQTTQAMSVQDQIAADRYLATKQAQAKGKRGFRLSKLVAPGASS